MWWQQNHSFPRFTITIFFISVAKVGQQNALDLIIYTPIRRILIHKNKILLGIARAWEEINVALQEGCRRL
jgi:hypothetical protein